MLSVINRQFPCCSVEGSQADLDFCGQKCDNKGWMKWMNMQNWSESWKLSPAGNSHVVGLGSRCKRLAHQVFYTAGVIACRLNHCTYMYIWHITSLLLSETFSIACSSWTIYPPGRKFSLEFKFRCFTNHKHAKFKFRLLLNFKNLSMIYMIEIQKSEFANISFFEFNQS